MITHTTYNFETKQYESSAVTPKQKAALIIAEDLRDMIDVVDDNEMTQREHEAVIAHLKKYEKRIHQILKVGGPTS